MIRFFKRTAASVAVVVSLVVGCEPGSQDPGPAPPVGSLELPPSPPPNTRKEIVLILPSAHAEFHEVWEQIARSEAGRALAILTVMKPKAGDPPGSQAELVREAAKRGASALIVFPADPELIAPALAEVRDKGLPIVLVKRPVPVTGKPFPLVTTASLEDSAQGLVSMALKDVETLNYSPTGPALLLVTDRSDGETVAQIAALQAALENAGVTDVEIVKFGSSQVELLDEEAKKAVLNAAASRSQISLILTNDDHGLSGAFLARAPLESKGQFALAGFMNNPATSYIAKTRECSAVSDLYTAALARQGVRTALKLMRGESVPDRIVIEDLIRAGLPTRPRVVRPH